MKDDKRKNRRGGFYFIDGKAYVSVTEVLKVIDKPSLRYWFGEQVFYAMVENPELSKGDALAAPYKKSGEARSRGTTIHSLVEAYKKSGVVIESVPDEFKGYAQAFYSWLKDNKVDILEQERTVFSPTHQYAGTLDILAKVNGTEFITDVKTGKGIYPESWLQLSAYQNALVESDTTLRLNDRVVDIAVLLLKENGTYTFEKGEPNLEAFLSAKKLWEWMNKDVYERMVKGKEEHG